LTDYWLAIVIIVVLLVATVAIVVWLRRQRTEVVTDVPVEEPILVDELREIVTDSLEDLHEHGDPRQAVIAAYANMERVLARHDLGRRPAETPSEYSTRLSADRRLSTGSVGGLTQLFVLARYSQHRIGTAMQTDAITALVAIRDAL
jgi:hypothetical protein